MYGGLKKQLFSAFFIMSFLLIMYCYTQGYFSLEAITQNREILQALVRNHYQYMALGYIFLYMIAVVCLFPFISFMVILGGFLFGTFWATLYSSISATIGVIILVSLIRYFFKDNVAKPQYFLHVLNTMVERHGIAYLLCVRFMVIIPFFVVNSVLGFTTIPLFTIAWTTCIGIIPVTLLCASAGQQLERIRQLSDLFSAKIIIVFAILALVTVLPVVFQRYSKKI